MLMSVHFRCPVKLLKNCCLIMLVFDSPICSVSFEADLFLFYCFFFFEGVVGDHGLRPCRAAVRLVSHPEPLWLFFSLSL